MTGVVTATGSIATGTRNDLEGGRKMQKTLKGLRSRANTGDMVQYRALYALCFTLFLGVVLVGRLMPTNWHSDGARASVFSEARARTDATVPMAFVGF